MKGILEGVVIGFALVGVLSCLGRCTIRSDETIIFRGWDVNFKPGSK